MNINEESNEEKWQKGRKAEEVAAFYLRLNGVFTIPNFAIHRDCVHDHLRTDADIVGVRFPHSAEHHRDERMVDDPAISALAENKTLFVLVEVKATYCKVNEPWTNGKMGRTIWHT